MEKYGQWLLEKIFKKINNMNICIFTRSMPAHREGKAMFHQDIIGPGLSKRGHQITVITTGRKDGIESEIKDGMSIFYLKGTPPNVYSKQFWRESAMRFDELHEKNRYDIVCSESEGAFGWAKYSEHKDVLPLIHIKHNTLLSIRKMMEFELSVRGIINFWGYLKQMVFYKNITEKLLDRADAIICVSKELANLLIKDYPLSKKKINVVYNGIQMNMFTPNEEKIQDLKRQLSISDEKAILYIGRLSPEKGIEYLIKSLSYLKDKNFKLVILGHGHQKYVKYLNDLVNYIEVKNKIILIKGVSYNGVPVYYGIADLVVLPSTYESFPFVLVEALASRKPVVGTSVGGIPEIIRDNENGYLIPPKNPEILAEKIELLLDNEDLRKSFAECGYKMVREKFALEQTLDNTEKILNQQLMKRGR